MGALSLLKVATILISLDIFDSITCSPVEYIGYNYVTPKRSSVYGPTQSSYNYSEPRVGIQKLLPAPQEESMEVPISFVDTKQTYQYGYPSSRPNEIPALKSYSYDSQSANTGLRLQFHNDYNNQINNFDDTTTDSNDMTTTDEDLDNRLAAPLVASLLGK